MARVIVTGGSGKVGRACVAGLAEHGYEVFNVDLVRPSNPRCPFTNVDFTDFGRTLEALSEIDDLYRGLKKVLGGPRERKSNPRPPLFLFARNRSSTLRPSIVIVLELVLVLDFFYFLPREASAQT